MNQTLNRKFIFHLLIILAIFTLDRVSKIYVINIAETTSTVDIFINDFLNIILVWNSGIGFGLFQFDERFAYNVITILILIINIVIIYLLLNSEKFHKILFAMILGGSFGNLYDRVYYSAVPDFIDLNYNGYHWFVFNVADIFISIGIFALIFHEVFRKQNEK
jgi:signal peptidase II|tara:strand:+ start:42 stop:530 length:489 start_codon:yes stop_codon:yes gene_type:complete